MFTIFNRLIIEKRKKSIIILVNFMNQQEFIDTIYLLKDKLYRFALSILNSKEDAEDIVNELFMKLWSRRNKLDNYKNIEAFCMQSVKNNCLDKIKHWKVKRTVQKELQPNDSYEHDTVEQKDMSFIIKQSINALPEMQKMVMHLRDIEEYELNEIAEVLEIDINAVRVNLSRARKKVRQQIQKLLSYEVSKNKTVSR